MNVVITGYKKEAGFGDIQAALTQCCRVFTPGKVVEIGMLVLNGREALVTLEKDREYFDAVFNSRVASVRDELLHAVWDKKTRTA